MAIFEEPTGTKYRLPFPGGSIISTDFFFNHYFNDTAFKAIVDQGKLVDVAASSYTRTLYPGGPARVVSRGGYQFRRYSMGVGTRNAVGKECHAKDGKTTWKFAISGPLQRFMTFADGTGKLKRVFSFKTAHGVPYSAS